MGNALSITRQRSKSDTPHATAVARHSSANTKSIFESLPESLILDALEYLPPHERVNFARTSKGGLALYNATKSPTPVPFPARVTDSRAREWGRRFAQLPSEMRQALEITGKVAPLPDIFSTMTDDVSNAVHRPFAKALYHISRDSGFKAGEQLSKASRGASRLGVPVPDASTLLAEAAQRNLASKKDERLSEACAFVEALHVNARATGALVPNLMPSLVEASKVEANKLELQWNDLLEPVKLLHDHATAARVPIPDLMGLIQKRFRSRLRFRDYNNALICIMGMVVHAAQLGVPTPDMTPVVIKAVKKDAKFRFVEALKGTIDVLQASARAAGVPVPNVSKTLIKSALHFEARHKYYDSERIVGLIGRNVMVEPISPSELNTLRETLIALFPRASVSSEHTHWLHHRAASFSDPGIFVRTARPVRIES